MIITDEYLTRHATGKMGWNRKQLNILGVSWPPQKGWKVLVMGKVLTDKQASDFENARTKTKEKDDARVRDCEYCEKHGIASNDIQSIIEQLIVFQANHAQLLSKEERKALNTAQQKVYLLRNSLNEFIRKSALTSICNE